MFFLKNNQGKSKIEISFLPIGLNRLWGAQKKYIIETIRLNFLLNIFIWGLNRKMVQLYLKIYLMVRNPAKIYFLWSQLLIDDKLWKIQILTLYILISQMPDNWNNAFK